jgi:hypothetical protein
MPPSLKESLESVSRSSIGPRQIFSIVRSALKFVAAATVAVFAYWNVLSVFRSSIHLPPRETEEVVMVEKRLAPVRENLLAIDYRGEIAYITDRVLAGLPPKIDDEKKWGQFQYVLIPWVLVRDKQNTPFVLADFSDGPPAVAPEGLSKVYDDGNGLILFRANHAP